MELHTLIVITLNQVQCRKCIQKVLSEGVQLFSRFVWMKSGTEKGVTNHRTTNLWTGWEWTGLDS